MSYTNQHYSPRAVLTQQEAADYLRIHRNTLRKLIQADQIKVVHIGKRVLVQMSEINNFLENNAGGEVIHV